MALFDNSQNFVYTGTTQYWTKPDLITSAYFIVTGGGGGGSDNSIGGNGAYVYANFRNLKRDGSFNVVINVGSGGKAPPLQTGGISVGGFIDSSGVSQSNGGSGTTLNGLYSGGGGGMSSVFYLDASGNRAIEVIAGGGGGGGTNSGTSGGASGGVGNPVDDNSAFSSIGFSGSGLGNGQGGNTNLDGNAGLGGINGGVNGYDFIDSSGAYFYIGGAGGGGGSFAGGGGGAGYGGAAGGKGGGGGGGGSYTNANTVIINTSGGSGGASNINGANGNVLVLWNATPLYPDVVVSQFMLNAQHTGKSIYNAPFLIPPSSQTKFYSTLDLLNPNSGVIGGDNELYIVSGDGSLYAFDHQFIFKWRYTISGYTFIGTPAIIPEGTIYISATTNLADKHFFALVDNDVSAGKKWEYLVDSNPSTSPVLDLNGNIYFGTTNGTIYALSDDTEQAVLGWKYPTTVLNIPVTGTPTIDLSYNKLCYTTTNDSISSSVYVIDLSTNHIANNIIPTQRWTNTITSDYYKTPSIKHNLTTNKQEVFISTEKGRIYAYDINNGNPIWPSINVFDASLSEIAIGANNLIYCTSTNYLNVIDSSNGTLEWKYPIDISGITPIVNNNSIPIIDSSNNIYFGARNNYLYAIDGSQRTFKWRYAVGGAIQSMPIISNEGNIYFGANDGKIYDLSGNSAPTPVVLPIVQMYMLNSLHTGQSAYTGPTAAPTSIVSVPFVSGNLFVSPSISISNDGILYIGSNDGYVYALYSSTGLVKWKIRVANSANPAGLLTSPNSMYTTPVIAVDGTIYIGSNEGYLYALNPADGYIKWSYYAGYPLQSSPIIDASGSIYFGAGTRVYAIGDSGFSAYSKWLAPFQTGANVNSSPALGTNGYVYFGSDDGYVYAVSSFTGLEKWRRSTNTTLPDLVHPIYMSATIDGSNNVIIGNGSYMDGMLYYLDGLTSTILWQNSYDPIIGPFYNTPAVRGDVIYLSTIAYVYAINRLTGAQIWKYFNLNFYYTSPIIDVNGKIYFASILAQNTPANGWMKNDGILHCLNADGTINWEIKVDAGRLAPPVLSNDMTIYISSTANKIYTIKYL